MSNANQETIADIVADIRAQNQGLPEDSYALSPLVCDLLSFADRIEAAHQREVDVVLKDRDEMFKSEQDTVAKTKEWFDEYQKLKLEVAELKSKMNDVVCENEALRDACGTCGAKREVAELRECLKEAIREKCPFTRMSCKHGEPCDYECGTEKWRKALRDEGGSK